MCAAASVSLTPRQSCLPFARVFAINLDRRPDRWQSLCAQLYVRAGVPAHYVERVRAVDGRDVDVAAARGCGLLSRLGTHRVRAAAADRIWGMDLTPAAIGCALTHALLWARIVALGACAQAQHAHTRSPPHVHTPQALHYLVVEDDSLFPCDFVSRYEARLRCVPPDWQLLYVSGLDTAGQCAQLRVAEGVCRVPQLHRTTNAYAVTPAGAARLLQRCLPLTYQLDTMMTMHVGVSQEDVPCAASAAVPYVVDPCCYTLQPPLVVQSTRFDSDIQDTRTATTEDDEERALCRGAAGWHDVP